MTIDLSRRRFLQQSKRTTLGLAAGVTLLRTAESVRGAPANEKLIFAAIGIGGRGSRLAHRFVKRGDCHYAYFADADIRRAGARAEGFGEVQGGADPKPIQDFREMLDDKSVDAVVSATPDHWHAPSTIWSCQAGKDVYIEKPASHSCWEGRKMVEAARKYNRVVQHGTQNRSAPYNMAARKFIEEGRMGTIHMCRIYNQKLWGNRPAVPDSDPPDGLSWDLWNGPAPEHPYNATLHRGWHHFWRYSGGDIANDASHQIDLARWLCGLTYPKQVCSMGGRYASEGALESPDSQFAIYEFDDMVVSFELTLYTPYMLKSDGVLRDSDMLPYWPQNATRIELYGTEGVMYVGRHGGGWEYYIRPKDRKPVVRAHEYGRFPDPEHTDDFVTSVRERRRPNADIEEGHISTLWVHYANISYRLGGERVVIDPETEHIVDNEEAMALFRREYRPPYVIEDEV